MTFPLELNPEFEEHRLMTPLISFQVMHKMHENQNLREAAEILFTGWLNQQIIKRRQTPQVPSAGIP